MHKDNVIKFGKAAKAIKRSRKEAKAVENRSRFGQLKEHKDMKALLAAKLQAKLDAHKLSKTPEKSDPTDKEK